MKVEATSCDPPPVVGRRTWPRSVPSPDSRWTLQLDKCQEINMGGSWRGQAQLIGNGAKTTDLGTIGFPAGQFVPWLDGDRAVWMDRRGRPRLVALDAPTSGTPLPNLKGQCYSIVCHGSCGAAMRMFGWRKHALTVFDADGRTIGEFINRHLDLVCAFTADGSRVVTVLQPSGDESPKLLGIDSSTGELTDEVDLDSVSDLPQRARAEGTGWRSLTRADENIAFGNQAGHPRFRVDDDLTTLYFGFEMPTGETIERFGKPRLVAVTEWLRVVVTP